MASLLVVEDDAPIAQLLTDHLERAGHSVRMVRDGKVAIASFMTHGADLVILDLMLPGCSGYEVCKAIRAESTSQPVIIMLTARIAEEDSILGYEVGADDYVRKPFGVRELMARVEAMLRLVSRARPGDARDGAFEIGDIRIDRVSRVATVKGQSVHFTPMEFDLLLYCADRAGATLRRDELLTAVWGYSHAGYARTVDSHVTRVRRKLKEAGLIEDILHTVHGVGYRFGAPR